MCELESLFLGFFINIFAFYRSKKKFVDPRLKFNALYEWLQVIYNEDQIKIEEIKNEVNSLLYILYNIYKKKYGNDISLIKSSSTTSS